MNPTTGSRATRIMGSIALVGFALTLLYGLVLSGPEVDQRDAARLLYLHVPSVFAAYTCFAITLVGSARYLQRKDPFWDLLAGSAAEVGVFFTAAFLITGALWGKPTWGVYWQWDPRLTSSAVLFIMYLSYLAVRRLDLPPDVRARRAAILGLVSFLNVFIVHFSVQWWRSLHQGRTLGIDTQMDGLMLFSFFLGSVTMLMTAAWLVTHRFRVAWLEHQIERQGLQRALAERRAESADYGDTFGDGYNLGEAT